MKKIKKILAGLVAAISLVGMLCASASANEVAVPKIEREFRAAWIASVDNINWPSKPGLPVAQQKAELLAMFDYAVKINLNAIILQMRPACDALYESKYEPWSEYLTGKMGVAPSPKYDPLEFAVTEAHKRGLELHAWINPYRAHHPSGKSPISADHISNTRPSLVRKYGKHLWLDPSEPAVRDYSIDVILDIVKRYDVDGIHMDDYFYPYQERGADKKIIDFPDEENWKKYQASGGKLSRSDWRREQVNILIERSYKAIKAAKPWVKFGLSPFGIWQPGHPPQIKGLNSYESLYADSRKWFLNGWVDYMTPQLYWSSKSTDQNYGALLKWWSEQNKYNRHLWPGNNTGGASKWGASEIVDQVQISRTLPGSDGHVHWHIGSLTRNRSGVSDALMAGPYAQPAVVPASPWLNKSAPGKPKLSTNRKSGELKISWKAGSGEKTWQWVLQSKTGDKWATRIFPANQTLYLIKADAGKSLPEVVALRAISRTGVESEPVIVKVN